MRLRLGISMVAILLASFAGPVGAGGYVFYVITPCRWVDTRVTGFPLAPGASRTFSVVGICGVVPWARALAFNGTVPVVTASGGLYFSPAGESGGPPWQLTPPGPLLFFNPVFSLPVDGSAAITVRNDSAAPIHLVIDLQGYFLRDGCTPPPPGMAGWWPFDEEAGAPVALDLAGGHHGTYVNSPAPVPGEVESARFFGPGQSVEVADAPGLDFGTGDFSFDAWLQTSRSGSSVDVILDKRDSSVGIHGYHVFLHEGRLCLQLGDGDSTNYCSAAFVADGGWHHVAITVERGASDGIHWYRDGTEVLPPSNPTAHPGSLDNSSPLSLAVRSASLGGGDYFQGALDEIELFPRILSAAEIQAIWDAEDGGKCH